MSYTPLKGRARIEQFLRAASLQWKIIDWHEGLDISTEKSLVVRRYPTGNGVVDYALFVGGKQMAIIQVFETGGHHQKAMHRAQNAAHAIAQWKGRPVPFLYAADGEAIYFLDARSKGNTAYRVFQFLSPRALLDSDGFPDSGIWRLSAKWKRYCGCRLNLWGWRSSKIRRKSSAAICWMRADG
ncbi:MAG: hypothetical protein GY765_19460 [bacterium]|nr:hypothetical protein [bacterium]